ncbi:MAG TPA: cytochrome c [Candidatus Binataceae bacterium]|nr:cytochrome c [Candidatus Binataceae bacterium]
MMLYKSAAVSLGVLLIVTLLPAQGAPAYAQEGAQLYSDNCTACHGQSGKGDGPAAAGLNPKPADFSKVLGGESDDWLAKVISGGGQAVGKAPMMPGFDGAFSAEQMQSLIGYLKELAAKK